LGEELTFSIWMNDMLRYRYTTLERIKLMLKHIPIGRIAFMYNLTSISGLFSTRDVVLDRIWVAMVANNMCHVVRVIEKGKRSRIHLLNTITRELKMIQVLFSHQYYEFGFAAARKTYEMYRRLSSRFLFSIGAPILN
jgi:hypothetical protein